MHIEWVEALRVSEVGKSMASVIVFGNNLDHNRVSTSLVIGMVFIVIMVFTAIVVFSAILDGYRVLFALIIQPPDRVSNCYKKTS
jgi:hypothetical protein